MKGYRDIAGDAPEHDVLVVLRARPALALLRAVEEHAVTVRRVREPGRHRHRERLGNVALVHVVKITLIALCVKEGR